MAPIVLAVCNSLERFYNDYKRYNKTHFWSAIANSWWTDNNEDQNMSYHKNYLNFRPVVVG